MDYYTHITVHRLAKGIITHILYTDQFIGKSKIWITKLSSFEKSAVVADL